MKHLSKRGRSTLVACVALALPMACADGSDTSGDPDRDALPPLAPPAAAADSAIVVGPEPDATAAGEPSEPLLYRIVLVNPGGSDVGVWAAAGAGRVALDTVRGGDSVRLDVRVRAREVTLEAIDGRGMAVGDTTLRLATGVLNRWVVPDSRR